MDIIIYFLIAVIIGLFLFNIYIDITEKFYYEENLGREKLISRLSEIRMKLIQMVHLGEIKPNSKYFVFIYASCSYLIRIIYKHEIDRTTLEKYNVLKNLYEELNCREKEKFCDSVCDEIKSLNNEQLKLLKEVSSIIIASYTISYLDKIIYNIVKSFILRFQGKLVSIRNLTCERVNQIIPVEIKIKYETAKTFDTELRAVLC